MTTISTVQALWNEWKRVYETAPDPAATSAALDNLRALDIWDDGQKNNSLDKGLNIWDIQDPPAGGQGSGQGPGGSESPDVGKTFDALMNQLPDDVKNKLKEKFAGEDNSYSDEEMTKVIELIRSKSGGDDNLSEAEIEDIRKELGGTGKPDPAEIGKTFDALMNQLPEATREQIKRKFADGDGVFSDSDKERAIAFIRSKSGGDDNLSTEEIEAIHNSAFTEANTRDTLYHWLNQLPSDVRRKIVEKFGGPDGEFNDDEALKAQEYLKSKIGDGPHISRFDVHALRKDLGTSESDMAQADINSVFDKWWDKLGEEARNKLKEKFAGEDGTFSDEERRKAVEYIANVAGYVPDPAARTALERSLGTKGRPTYSPDEVNMRVTNWMTYLPEDVIRKLKEMFAGSDKEFDDAEKTKLLKWLDVMVGTEISGSSVNAVRDAVGVKEMGLTQDEINKKFDSWMTQLPQDIRDVLKLRFAGPDGLFNDAEKAQLINTVGSSTGIWGNDVRFPYTEDLIRHALGVKKP